MTIDVPLVDDKEEEEEEEEEEAKEEDDERAEDSHALAHRDQLSGMSASSAGIQPMKHQKGGHDNNPCTHFE